MKLFNGNIRCSGPAGGDASFYHEGQNANNPNEEPSVHINGGNGSITVDGDIILKNADCA